MTSFEIIKGKAYHAGQMTRRLRVAHKACVVRLGFDAHATLRDRFSESAFCRSWMIDGRLGAFGGVTGTPLSPSGIVWLAFTEDALDYRREIIRESRRQLDGLMRTKAELITLILSEDATSRRFAEFLGFDMLSEDDHGIVMIYRRLPGES